LGHSGSSTAGRTGFRRLADDVAHGRVGAIFSIEVSRLARSSADWHQLLDLCRLADVVIVDENAVYDPRDYNDKLLLGIKGTLSEAELNWMRLRLDGGRLNKARRGEYHYLPPAGYEWDEDKSGFRMTADEEIQRAVRLVFERFRIEGSAYGVFRYLHRNGIKLPARNAHEHAIRWTLPRCGLVVSMLHNPIYAGAYTYGRHDTRAGLVDGQIRLCHRKVPEPSWAVCLPGRHTGYIDWEEYVANQSKLRDNRTDSAAVDCKGAAREGAALLQGLALCGRCGRRMIVHYRPWGVQYYCRADDGRPKIVCWSVSGNTIDQAVVEVFLAAVKPAEIELGLAAVRQIEQQAQAVDEQWKLRKERVQYEASLAERRYKAVDPDNRVVARTLERDWNEKLRELEDLERQYQQIRRDERLDLSQDDRARILELSRDLGEVWNAPSTSNAERKNLLRMLIRDVTLTPVENPDDQVRIRVLWETGAVTELNTPRLGVVATATPAKALAIIRTMVKQGKRDAEIASALNRRGLGTGRRPSWTAGAVERARYAYGNMRHLSPKAPPIENRRDEGLHSVSDLSARFGVRPAIIQGWARKGTVKPVAGGGGPSKLFWFRLDEETIKAIEAAKAALYKNLTPNQRRLLFAQEVHCE
jgi:DNA invertase Pin-like site-specific DNA recombinase